MSSKFLQVFGCTIDVAVDGVGAVERMNLEKYDLVLMVGFFLFLDRKPGGGIYWR
jgi:osomolarity two-component system response regulator SKN7